MTWLLLARDWCKKHKELCFAILAIVWLGASVFLVFHVLSDERKVAEFEAEARLKNNAGLMDAGVSVEETVPKAVADQKLAELVEANDDLRAQLKAALAAAPGAQVVGVGHAVTKPVAVTGTPRPPPVTTAPPLDARGTPSPPVTTQCLLALGDTAQIELDEAQLLTSEGVHLHLLALSAYRISPEPKTKLFSDGVAVPLTEYLTREAPTSFIPPSPKRLFLSVTPDWNPRDIRLRPEVTAALTYAKWRLGPLDLGATFEVGYWYAPNNTYEWNVRVGPHVEIAIW